MMGVGIEIALIAVAISAGIFIVNKKVVNQKRMKQIKKRMKVLQKESADLTKQGNTAKAGELNKEMMGLAKEQMMSGFKPLLYTFIPIILVISAIGSTYGGSGFLIQIPVFGWIDWLGWYILIAIGVGIMLEVIYNVYNRTKDKKSK